MQKLAVAGDAASSAGTRYLVLLQLPPDLPGVPGARELGEGSPCGVEQSRGRAGNGSKSVVAQLNADAYFNLNFR